MFKEDCDENQSPAIGPGTRSKTNFLSYKILSVKGPQYISKDKFFGNEGC